MTEDMVGWHHRLNGHEFEQTLGDIGGQGSLARCSPCNRKELDTATEQRQGKVGGRQYSGFFLFLEHVWLNLETITLSLPDSQQMFLCNW